MDLALCVGRRLSRRVAEPAERADSGDAREIRRGIRSAGVRGHGTLAGTHFCEARGDRVDWEEHAGAESADGVVVLSWSGADYAGADDFAWQGRGAACRSLRELHEMHRCVPYGRADRALRDGRPAVHFLSDDRASRADSGGISRGNRGSRLWLRYLSGCLSVESAGTDQLDGGVSAESVW